MMGKACIGEDSARSAEKKCILGRHKNWGPLKASRTGLTREKKTNAQPYKLPLYIQNSLSDGLTHFFVSPGRSQLLL